MAIIANKDDDLKYKKQQIELFFSVHSDAQERADYLKSAYHDRYTEIIADGQRLGYKPQENGLLMWEGSYPSRTRESVFSWDIVAQWTAQLIDKKEYFIQTDIPRLPDQESQQMSLFDFAAFQQPAQAEYSPTLHFPHPALLSRSSTRRCALVPTTRTAASSSAPISKRISRTMPGSFPSTTARTALALSGWPPVRHLVQRRGNPHCPGRKRPAFQRHPHPLGTGGSRIRELLDLGRYMPQSELDRVDGYERQQRAAQLWYLRQDFAEGTTDAGYLPTVNAIYGKNHGFPEESAA